MKKILAALLFAVALLPTQLAAAEFGFYQPIEGLPGCTFYQPAAFGVMPMCKYA